MNKSQKYFSVAFFNDGTSQAKLDLSMLRGIGARSINVLRSFDCCNKYFSSNSLKKELFIYNENGDHKNLKDFVSLLEKNQLKQYSILIISNSKETKNILKNTGLVVLERPYTQVDLSTHVDKAMKTIYKINMEAIYFPKEQVTTKIKKTIKPCLTAKEIYEEAISFAQHNQLEKAKENLFMVVKKQPDHADAYLLLTKVFMLLNEPSLAEHSLIRSVAACYKRKDQEKALKIALFLPEELRTGNIFCHDASRNMESGDYKSAAISFMDAADHDPSTPLCSLISRTCMLTDAPQEHIARVCKAFSEIGQKDLSYSLNSVLLSEAKKETKKESSWASNFPLLYDIAQAASFTLRIWRQA